MTRTSHEEPAAGTVVLSVEGPLDMAGAAAVEPELTRFSGHARRLIVDLSRVPFLASIGMRGLLAAAKAMDRDGRKLVLLAPVPRVAETLRTAGVATLVAMVEDREEAMSI